HRATQEAGGGFRGKEAGGGRQDRSADQKIQAFRRAIKRKRNKRWPAVSQPDALPRQTRRRSKSRRRRRSAVRHGRRLRKYRLNRRRRCSRGRPPIGCSATSCSTPKCACIAG